MQVNSYADRAAMAADQQRLGTKSSVSFIQDSSAALHGGVNCVIYDKNCAGEGDLVCHDADAGQPCYVKAATLVKAQLPANLTPVGVVYARKGAAVLVVSLSNAVASRKWAHPYEVAIGQVNTSAAGSVSVTVKAAGTYGQDTVTVPYEAGATLETIAAALTSAFAALENEHTKCWTAEADGERIILSHNYWSKCEVESVSGAAVLVTDETDWQNSYALVTANQNVRRENGVNSNSAGCNFPRFLDYYSESGTTPTSAVGLRSSTIVNRTAFESGEYCSALREAYPDYESYLRGEHMLRFPGSCPPLLVDGEEATALLAAKKGSAVRGADEPLFPAALQASQFDAGAEGFGAGMWHLPSAEEIVLLMQHRRLNANDETPDPVNDTLKEMGKTSLYASNIWLWTCCEHNVTNAFSFNGSNGSVGTHNKYGAHGVRPVSAL